MPRREFLAAMDGYQQTRPGAGAVLSPIKATVKGGIGKLRERPAGRAASGRASRGPPWTARPGAPTSAPPSSPRARINMHRKMLKLAAAHAGLYPVAILSDCAVYASDGPSPARLPAVPRTASRCRAASGSASRPGMVKHEGTQSVLWAEAVRADRARQLNPARHIKGGTVTADDGE